MHNVCDIGRSLSKVLYKTKQYICIVNSVCEKIVKYKFATIPKICWINIF